MGDPLNPTQYVQEQPVVSIKNIAAPIRKRLIEMVTDPDKPMKMWMFKTKEERNAFLRKSMPLEDEVDWAHASEGLYALSDGMMLGVYFNTVSLYNPPQRSRHGT